MCNTPLLLLLFPTEPNYAIGSALKFDSIEVFHDKDSEKVRKLVSICLKFNKGDYSFVKHNRIFVEIGIECTVQGFFGFAGQRKEFWLQQQGFKFFFDVAVVWNSKS